MSSCARRRAAPRPLRLGSRLAPLLLLVVLFGCRSDPPPAVDPLLPPPGPPQDGEFRPEDPRWKQAWVAVSPDGLHWEPQPGPLAPLASSPQLVRVGDQLRVYYVHHGRSIAWIPFEGGASTPVAVQGLEGGMQVDPCIVPLADGGLRLYLVHHPAAADPGLTGRNRVLSARSSGDGAWTLEPGVRIEGAWVDPDVVALPDGGVRMFLTRSTREVASAHSQDGLEFGLEDGLRFEGGGVTSTLQADDGWWMYHHEAGTLGRARSADGFRFGAAEHLVIPQPEGGPWMLESPSVLRDGDRWLMTYVLAPTHAGQVQ